MDIKLVIDYDDRFKLLLFLWLKLIQEEIGDGLLSWHELKLKIERYVNVSRSNGFYSLFGISLADEYFVDSGNVIQSMFQSGADVNQPAYDGNTALHLAVSMNRLGIAALLMAADADPNAENMEVEDEESFGDYDDEESDVENTDEQVGEKNNRSIAADQERTGVTPKDVVSVNGNGNGNVS